MEISDEIYIYNISTTFDYWRHVANKEGASVFSLLKKIIRENHKGDVCAVFCNHPFKGLLFLNYLLDRRVYDIIILESDFSKRSFENIDWFTWKKTILSVHEVFKSSDQFKKEAQGLKAKLSQLERFLNRMGLNNASSLSHAKFSEIGRRFGTYLALFWKWTTKHCEKKTEEFNLFTYQNFSSLMGFAWIPYKPIENFVIYSVFDYPLSCFEEIKVNLIEDISKFKNKFKVPTFFQVMTFQWTITTFDGEEHCGRY